MGTLTFQQLGRYGRLGNQMFQIASTIGIARRNGWQYAFPEWKNYDHLERFNTTEDIDVQKYFLNKLPVYNGPALARENFVHWGYWPIRLPNARYLSLTGHMQSEKYFEHCQDEVRHYFKMVDEYPSADYCALHVRLGDYDDNYHPRLKMDYYGAAIKYMLSVNQNMKFAVFSDDIKEAVRMLSNSGIFHEPVSTFNTMEDFKLMKACKHFIIGNSTYSWWAAWLGDQPGKKVVAPSRWFGPVAGLSAKDIYCKNWTVI